MEMEMEAGAEQMPAPVPDALAARFELAIAALEAASARLAAVELQAAATRESDLSTRLAEAETTIAQLRASAGRKTGVTGTLAAKDGVAIEAGALDTALQSLSLEQRIAVKAQLLRSGLLG